jgi:arylsulfatase A-like enzyme
LRRLAVAIFAAMFACTRPSTEDNTSFFFIDHLNKASITIGEQAMAADPQNLWDRVTLRYETRRALTPSLPSRLTFEVEVPQDPVIRFTTAASTMGQRTLLAPVEFRLLVGSGADEDLIFTDTIPRSRPNRWIAHEVDLSPWAESKVRLSLETRRGTGGIPSTEHLIQPLWGNPVLVNRNPRSSRPNLILISVDCLRADHVGAYGYERDTTAHIDEFAREATLFRNAMSTSSYTLPTHVSMLTGLPPSIHGADRVGVSKSIPYVPELLAESGYRVNGVVSAPFLDRAYGFDRGFHTYRNMLTRAARVVDDALVLLQEGLGQAQFLFLHIMDAHWTYAPPKEFLTRFGERPRDISSLLDIVGTHASPTPEELAQIISLYDAEIAYLDQELGRFFAALKQMDIYDDSLILLTADHGEAFLEHGHWEHARPWRHDGPGLYDEIVHVPLIVKWPRESSFREITNVVSQVDIFRTLSEAAGLEASTTWARSLRHYVDPGIESPPPRHVVAELFSRSARDGVGLQIALRSDNFKYIASFRASTVEDLFSGSIQKEELYHLGNDPREEKNLLLDSHQDVGPFRNALEAYLAEVQKGLRNQQGEEITLDERLLEDLRELGYVEK